MRSRAVTFTRSRPYHKNDGCYVEQKNGAVVRRTVGYARYDTPGQLHQLNALYAQLRLYTNYFQPLQKLHAKERAGARVRRHYDTAQTPFQRVLAAATVSDAAQAALRAQYPTLHPAALHRAILRAQHALWGLTTTTEQPAEVHA